MQRQLGPFAANLMCILSMIIWSLGLPAADVVLKVVAPLPLAAARMSLAALTLLPLWWLIEGRTAMMQANWRRGLMIGGATMGLGAFLMVQGQSMTSPVTMAVISAMMPVVAMALEVMFDGRRIRLPLALGMALCLIGGVIALGARVEGLGLNLGALICLASVVAFTIGSRMTVTSLPGLSPLGRTSVTLSGAAITTLLVALAHSALTGMQTDWSALGGREWGALAFFGIAGLAISQVFFIMAVGSLGIGLATMHINVTPFYVMLILFAMGGSWNWTQALGAAIVGVGVLVAQTRKRAALGTRVIQ